MLGKELKLFSRVLGVPKSDIEYLGVGERGLGFVFGLRDSEGVRTTYEPYETWVLLPEGDFTLYWTSLIYDGGFVSLPEEVKDEILDHPEKYINVNNSYFDIEFHTHNLNSVEYWDSNGELLEMAVLYGVLTEEDVESGNYVLDAVMIDLSDALDRDISAYSSYFDWWMDEVGDRDELEYLLDETIIPYYTVPVKQFIRANNLEDAVVAPVDGIVERSKGYCIFRTV